MDRFEEMRTFAAPVETGSFTMDWSEKRPTSAVASR
jgi:hypothetical protein